MELEDCYFIVDMEDTEENQKIQIFCVDCYQKSNNKNGWYWDGSVRGYGPYLFKCQLCEKILYKPEE